MKADTSLTTTGDQNLHNQSPQNLAIAPTGLAVGKLMRIHEVIKTTGLGRSTIYDLMKINDFPKPVKLGCRWVAWRSQDVDAWMASLTN